MAMFFSAFSGGGLKVVKAGSWVGLDYRLKAPGQERPFGA